MKIEFPEGATPLSDYSGLKISWVQFLSDLNRAEAENIYQAQKKYLQKPVKNPIFWFTPKHLKRIHWTMFNKVWAWAGEYRKSITNLGIKPQLIPYQLSLLCYEVRDWSATPNTLLFKAAKIHHKLVSIHPFENGNGRFSRLVADIYMKAFNHSHPIWPSLETNSNARTLYIQSLKSADQGDYEPLINFMIQSMNI